LYRLIHVFYEGNNSPSDVFISTIKARTRINALSNQSFSVEETKNAVKRCEKFLGRFCFLNKVKNMYISFLLQLAFLWHTTPLPHIREILEKEEFLLKFAEENLKDETMMHNTLNNGPNETHIIKGYPGFKQAFMIAYDENKPESDEINKKKKDTIPSVRKTEVWGIYVGEEIGKTKCVCCGIRDITARDFVAGHVIPENDGGTIDIENLRPICAVCNSGMGSRHMVAWMKKLYPTRVLAGGKIETS
jgi:hypothetical protein